jgi:hypothetical protein
MAIDVADIKNRGWYQGAVFTADSTREILADSCPGVGVRLILATHDCDLVHRGTQEPFIDVFVAAPVKHLSSTESKARNARRLHIPIAIREEPKNYELKVWSRRSLPREVLNSHMPAADAHLRESLPVFRSWLGKRYDRAAWPDAFNKRLGPDSHKRLRELLGPSEYCFREIFLSIEPADSELSIDEGPYVVRVALIMSEADTGRPEFVAEAQRCKEALNKYLTSCQGIDVEIVEVMSDTDFTWADLDTYRPWDFTDLSFPD